MKTNIPLAWRQLSHEKSRLFVAIAGIAFADFLMFVQLGFQAALYDSNTQIHRSLRADLVLISPQAQNISSLSSFPRNRLYQAMSFAGVKYADALYADFLDWKNPETRLKTSVLFLGFNPEKTIFNLPEVEQNLDKIKLPDTLLFDRGSQGNYESTVAALTQGETLNTEVSNRRVKVDGLFTLGASFVADGNVITSDLNFLRIFRNRTASEVSAGLITLEPNSNAQQMAAALQASLPDDVKVLTIDDFIEFEKTYWANTTPIGFIFSLGTVIGFVVGVVIVYQILYTDVTDNLAEYATLKAIGYKDIYLFSVVFQEALILAFLGFIPGIVISVGIYQLAKNATLLPIIMTVNRAGMVLILTMLMCTISGAIAIRKISTADPADIF